MTTSKSPKAVALVAYAAAQRAPPALHFTSGNNVSVGTITLSQRVTVTAWIRTTGGGQQPAFSNRGNGLYFGTSGGKFFTYYNSGSPSSMSSVATINDGKWHHVAWTSDGVTEKMYVDGSLNSTQSQTRAGGDAGAAYVGYDVPNGEYFNGDISEVAIYGDVAP